MRRHTHTLMEFRPPSRAEPLLRSAAHAMLQPLKGVGRSKMKKHMRQHHAQRPELPVFYNIHSVSNFISLANAFLVEIIEA